MALFDGSEDDDLKTESSIRADTTNMSGVWVARRAIIAAVDLLRSGADA
jgi:hypothetical protein